MSDGAAPRPALRRLRRLSEEEIELWLSVAATVVARQDSTLPARVATPAAAPAIVEPDVAASVLPPPAPAKRSGLPPLAPLERKLKRRLSRGQASADAAIDLHGLRQDAAQSALLRFLQGAQIEGARVVLVVTGKGGRSVTSDLDGSGIGILRRMVPLWLGLPAFRPLVLGYEEAARTHGGSGALYVRLRRRES